MAMVEVDNLSKVYGTWPAVTEVSFGVEQGEILGFLGPNGAGKSTTMKMLTCFQAPSSGTARIGGFDILEDSVEVRRLIGYLPESTPLYRDMTVRGYLHYCAALRGVPRRDRDDRVDESVEKMHLEEVSDTIIGKLSKGFRQRVGIGQAMVHNPPVLILDEPTIGLDPRQIIDTRSLIKGLGQDHTIILSTHILQEVAVVCSSLAIINGGRIVAADTIDNLTGKSREGVLVQMRLKRAPGDVTERLKRVSGVLTARRDQKGSAEDQTVVVEHKPNLDLREELGALAVKEGWGLLELRRAETTLEDLFLRITTQDESRVEMDRN